VNLHPAEGVFVDFDDYEALPEAAQSPAAAARPARQG
jgi:hypothetical protein